MPPVVGGVMLTVTEPLPAATLGAAGTFGGLMSDGSEVPTPLVAVTRK